jgi:hypothetical protein
MCSKDQTVNGNDLNGLCTESSPGELEAAKLTDESSLGGNFPLRMETVILKTEEICKNWLFIGHQKQ